MSGMKIRSSRWFVVLLLVILALPWAVWAKEPPVRATVQLVGDSMVLEVDAEDLVALGRLGMGLYSTGFISEPERKGAAIELQFYHSDPKKGTEWPGEHLVYYFDPDGNLGYVHFVGYPQGSLIGWSSYNGKWFRAKPAGEKLMRKYFERLGAASGGDPQ